MTRGWTSSSGQLAADPAVAGVGADSGIRPRHPFLQVRLRSDAGELAFFTATAEIGTALSITLRNLHLELFFPADAATRALFEGPPPASRPMPPG
jgi:hypothetical protein